MRELLDKPLFRTASAPYAVAEAVLAAVLRCEWGRVEQRLRQCVSCERLAAFQGNPVNDRVVATACEEFRYAQRNPR